MSEEIQGQLIGDRVHLAPEALPELYEQSYYVQPGRPDFRLYPVQPSWKRPS